MTDIPQSLPVSASDQTAASQYNDLRKDVLTSGYPNVYNESGGDVNQGDVVIFDKATAGFKTTAVQGDSRVLGVVGTTVIHSLAAGRILVGWGMITLVNTVGVVAIGNALITSTTPGKAMANGGAMQPGLVGFALQASAGPSGQVLAILYPNLTRAGGQATQVTVTEGNSVGGGASTPIAGFSVTGNNRLLVLIAAAYEVAGGAEDISAVSWNGAAMTLADKVTFNTNKTISIWYLLAPAVATGDFVVTTWGGGGNNYVSAVGILFNDVNQATPVTVQTAANANSDSPAIAETCVPGDYLIGAAYQHAANTVSGRGAGQANLSDTTYNTLLHLVVDKFDPAVANSENLTWTMSGAAWWGTVGLAVHPL